MVPWSCKCREVRAYSTGPLRGGALGGWYVCPHGRVSREDSVTAGVWCCVFDGVTVWDTVLKGV